MLEYGVNPPLEGLLRTEILTFMKVIMTRLNLRCRSKHTICPASISATVGVETDTFCLALAVSCMNDFKARISRRTVMGTL